jgi:hypothetical protein
MLQADVPLTKKLPSFNKGTEREAIQHSVSTDKII